MKQKRLDLYHVHLKYVRDLSKVDDHVMSISPQINKNNRPFLGLIVVCNERTYCIPLSSPKKKHVHMKNDIDFIKILDGEKIIGILNINNMIPVNQYVITPVELKINEFDSSDMIRYKTMIIKELTWCRKNHSLIENRVNKLYKLIYKEKCSISLKNRCCKFKELEKICDKYDKKLTSSSSPDSHACIP